MPEMAYMMGIMKLQPDIVAGRYNRTLRCFEIMFTQTGYTLIVMANRTNMSYLTRSDCF